MASHNSTPSSPVCYVPPQLDGYRTASKRALQQSPLQLFLRDALVLIRLLKYLPWIFLPLDTRGQKTAGPLQKLPTVREKLLQAILLVVEIVLLLLIVPAFISLPGLMFLLAVTMSIMSVWLLALPMAGPSIVHSTSEHLTSGQASQYPAERWIFVNGCASGHDTLQGDIDCISSIFGRPVIGIHNKTYGLVADLLECLIQRTFEYKTTDVRVAYDQIRSVLCDPIISKVVLMGHSQGGIVISMVIDQLLTELPPELMRKAEIYTFGSAASHFANPPLALDSLRSRSLDPPRPRLVIPHIEHYANEYDMVPRWGVLNSTKSMLSNRYAGSVFVRMRTSGHMFVKHYIDRIFCQQEVDCAEGHPFLDQVVDLDLDLVNKRDSAETEQLLLMRNESGLQFGDGERIVDGGKDGADVLTFDRTGSGRLLVGEVRGKTLRALSRLWKYQGGKSPD